MVRVSGTLVDFVEDPSIVAQVQVRAREVRPHGDGVMLDHPVKVDYAPPTGTVTFDAAAGTAGVIMWHAVGRSNASGSLPIVVPEGETATLRECVEAAMLADEGTISALERLALEVTGMVATLTDLTQLEEWADSAKQDATTAREEADRAEAETATIPQEVQTALTTSLAPTIQTELDTRVPPEVAEALSTDRTIRDAATLAVNDAVDAGLPGKADTTYVDAQDTALGQRITDEKWYRGNVPAGTSTDALHRESDMGVWGVGSSTLGTPRATPGVLEVIREGFAGRTRQRFVSFYPGDTWAMERTYSGGVWSAWMPGTWLSPELGAADNLDTMIGKEKVGFYPALSGTVGLPVAVPGWVEIVWERGASRTQQTFIASTTAEVGVEYRRVHSSGAWTTWHRVGWGREQVATGANLNDLTTPGLYDVTNMYTINSPLPAIGSLTVTHASGATVQEYTTTEHYPRTFKRTKNGDMWSAWQEPARTVPRKMTWDPTPVSVASWENPAEISHDGEYWWSVRSYRLRVSTDEGATWQVVLDKPGEGTEEIKALPNGEMLLVTDGHVDRIRRVYISEGMNIDPFTATWTQVTQGHAKHVKFPVGWSIHVHDNIILLSEYGPKANGGWQGDDIAEGDNARYVLMSEDYGKTWRTIFDLNEWLASQGRGLTNQHPHGVAWDPWWQRVWFTFGDNFAGQGSNGVLYSDDKGATWQIAKHISDPGGTGATGSPQVVGIQPMEKCILFVGDQYPSGVMRIDRDGGKTRTVWEWHVAYQHHTGRHLGGELRRVTLPNGDTVAYVLFTPEGVATRSFVVATRDGYQWDVLWEDPVETPVNTVGGAVVGPTRSGELVAHLSDLKVAGKWTQLRGPVDFWSSDAAANGHLREMVHGLEEALAQVSSQAPYTGTGFPEGRVSAPVGATYTDTAATNGAVRWIKTSGTGNTGWEVEYGDTGWRRLDPVGQYFTGEGGIFFRRTGNLVTIRFADVGIKSTIAQNVYLTATYYIPQGFRVGYTDRPSFWVSNNNANPNYLITIAQGSRIRYQSPSTPGAIPGTGSQALQGQGSWRTDDPWPTTLPGTPE